MVLKLRRNENFSSHHLIINILNKKSVLRFLSNILCLFGFLYQSSQLLRIYFSDKTVVEVRFEPQLDAGAPSVTLCLPTFLSMERVAQKYPEMKGLYDQYLQLAIATDNIVDHQNQSVVAVLEEYYNRFEEKVRHKVTVGDVFDDLTYSYVKLSLFGFGLTPNNTIIEFSNHTSFPSVNYGRILPHKCFTFDLLFDSPDRIRLLSLFGNFSHDNRHYPWSLHQFSLFVALHSPRSHPKLQLEYFRKMYMGALNFFYYSVVQTKLLPPPYETQCQEYHGDQVRGDCESRCYMEQMRRRCNAPCHFIYWAPNIIRRKSFNDSSDSICSSIPRQYDKLPEHQCSYENIYRIHSFCENRCPKDCYQTIYKQDSEKGPIASYFNTFYMQISHLKSGDLMIKYKPVMRFIEVVSDFGGLLGMWLGLSASALFDLIIKRI